MLLQIHDELLFEVETDAVDATTKHVKGVMSDIAELKVPMIVDVNIGANWAKLKG